MSRLPAHRHLLLVVISATVLTWSCRLCGERQIAESLSPDQQYVAAVYVRDCGATTAYVTHVNLERRGDIPRTTWTGTIVRNELMSVEGESSVSISWNQNSVELLAAEGRVIRCAQFDQGITVSCASRTSR